MTTMTTTRREASSIVDIVRGHADRAADASAAAHELGDDHDDITAYVNAAYIAAIAAEDAAIDALGVARDIVDWRARSAYRWHIDRLHALVQIAAEYADDAEAALADAERMASGAAAR